MTAYASRQDLIDLGLPETALGRLTIDQINAELESASTFADSFFRARYGQNAVPFQAWDSSVTKNVAKIAALGVMRIRGFAQASATDTNLQLAYNEAVEWLNKVQRQQAHPLVTLAQSASAPLSPKLVSSSVVNLANGARATTRGW